MSFVNEVGEITVVGEVPAETAKRIAEAGAAAGPQRGGAVSLP